MEPSGNTRHPKLSICISTRNRAAFIGQTLQSIVDQATPELEIVVLDAASTDETENVVRQYACRCQNLHYLKQIENNGFDRDFDRAVEMSRGDYCWLLPDDDVVKPGAVKKVLNFIDRKYALILANVEYTNFEMSKVLDLPLLDLNISKDREYKPDELDSLFADCWKLIRYVGCVVIRRDIWLARDRKRYYDSSFIHVGVIFQELLPEPALLLAEPLIRVRMGNQSWLTKWFEIFYIRWPFCVSSLVVSDAAKREALADDEWSRFRVLLMARAAGQYSLAEYRACVRHRLRSRGGRLKATIAATLPGVVVNALFVFHYSFVSRRKQREPLLLLKQSRFYWPSWRLLERD